VPRSVSVFGAAGFTGALTARLLYCHPSFELKCLTARSDHGRRLDELYPHHRVPLELEELDLDRHAEVEAAVVAYPHGAAAPLVAELRARGVRVVDLSADFRLRDAALYERWYREHHAPELLDGAVYGLPERYREQIATADLVANPGCYPTATLLALAPLARAGAIADVVIDAKSGVSGAGRNPSEKTHFVTADENVNAYGVPAHRHIPEIEQELAALGAEVRVTFVPHLVPLDQGELVSCYVTLSDDVEDLERLYGEAYGGEPFVELTTTPPGVRDVRETNICRISVHRDTRTGRAIAFAAIDNLWKGAASQAVQNLNLMFGLAEDEGIGPLAVGGGRPEIQRSGIAIPREIAR
jgi:N-acetyl-gamma-glutamyl-phosphate reductase